MASNRSWAWALLAIPAFFGCAHCASDYDYCGPLYTADGCGCSCCNEIDRSGSSFSGYEEGVNAGSYNEGAIHGVRPVVKEEPNRGGRPTTPDLDRDEATPTPDEDDESAPEIDDEHSTGERSALRYRETYLR